MESMYTKSMSTGKFRESRIQPERIKEYSSCTKLVHTEAQSADHRKSRPVKIAQLLGLNENAKSTQKDTDQRSTKKRAQPERLGKLYSHAKSAVATEKKSELRSYRKSVIAENRVRRNLNFNEIPVNAQKNLAPSTTKKKPTTERKTNINSVQPNRKSFLLPPNSIKDTHLKKQQTKSRRSKIPKASEKTTKNASTQTSVAREKPETKCVLCAEPLGDKDKMEVMDKVESVEEALERSDAGYVERVENIQDPASPSALTPYITVSESSVFSRCSARRMQQTSSMNDLMNIDKDDREENQVEDLIYQTPVVKDIDFRRDDEEVAKDLRKSLEHLCDDLQNANLEDWTDGTMRNDSSPETIRVNKTQIVKLERNLKSYIQAVEDNILKLKSTWAQITQTLSTDSSEEPAKPVLERKENVDRLQSVICFVEKNVESVKSVSPKNSDEQDPVEATTENKVEDEACLKLMEVTNDDVGRTIFQTPDPVSNNVEDFKEDELKDEEEEVDKENLEILEGLKEMMDPEKNDSFLELENELNITHAKQTVEDKPIRYNTPLTKRSKDRRGGRSLREYMVLKSSMTFLQTPDPKRFKSLGGPDAASDQPFLNKARISNKVLTDLHNLYESPDL